MAVTFRGDRLDRLTYIFFASFVRHTTAPGGKA